jgi:hypothetical protein
MQILQHVINDSQSEPFVFHDVRKVVDFRPANAGSNTV